MNEITPKKCHAHNRSGSQCRAWAVPGKNVCRMHGANAGRPVTKPETIVKKQIESNEGLRERAEQLQAKGVDLLDLTPSLALFAIMREDLADQYAKGETNEKLLELMLALSESNRKHVETIERIRNSTALTAAEMQGISAVLHLMLNDLATIYAESTNVDEFVSRAKTNMQTTIKNLSGR